MPYSATSAAATSSLVDSGFEAASTTSAPPALSVRIRLAVSVVTWRQAPMRRPSSGRSRSKRSRIRREHGHLALGPFDPADALGGEAEVGDVVGRQAWCAVIGGRSPCGRTGGAAAPRSGPRRAEPMDQPLLEASVLGEAEAPVGVDRRRVVGADVEHDLVARPQQLGGHGAGDGGREAATAVVACASARCRRPRAARSG